MEDRGVWGYNFVKNVDHFFRKIYPPYHGGMGVYFQSNRAFKFTFPNPEMDDEEITLQNVKPVYNKERGWYWLDFYGRATAASAKNFQMIEENDESEDIVLMHGKDTKGEYNVDYRSPLNPAQAFCISLAAIGHKRAVG